MHLRSLKQGDLILIGRDGSGKLDPLTEIESGSRVWIITSKDEFGLRARRVNDVVGGSLPFAFNAMAWRRITKKQAVTLLLELP